MRELYFTFYVALFLGAFIPALSWSAPSCPDVFISGPISADESLLGAHFLHQQNGKLHSSFPVETTVQHLAFQKNSSPEKPAQKLNEWLKYLERSYKTYRDHPEVLANIKKYYLKKYVITRDEIPNSYFELQARIARERGHGNITLSENQKNILADSVIKDQETSFGKWLNYLLSSDTDMYPMWMKYWFINSMTKLGKFDVETGKFSKRDKGTVTPFPELNPEALSIVADALAKKVYGKPLADLEDPGLLPLLNDLSFGKIYGKVLFNLAEKKITANSTDGKWVHYKQGSDHRPLAASLAGMNTGWCTAGESTAQLQLDAGDFYVFYSNDETGVPKIPRIAIRMDGSNTIAEVRGVGADQNIDRDIANTEILENKLAEFGDEGAKYKQKVEDMRLLTEIENKTLKNIALSKQELQFLYELDRSITGFGQQSSDPRVLEIRQRRNYKNDLIILFDLPYHEEEMAIEPEDPFRPGIRYYKGSLEILDKNIDRIRLPEYVEGTIAFRNAVEIKNMTFPEKGNYFVYAPFLTKMKDVTFQKNSAQPVPIQFGSLRSIENVHFPESALVVNLDELTKVKDSILPKHSLGDYSLGVDSLDGINLPESVGGRFTLWKLKKMFGAKLPRIIKGAIDFPALISAEDISFPKNVHSLFLKNLRNVKNVSLPEKIDHLFYLYSPNVSRQFGHLPEISQAISFTNPDDKKSIFQFWK